MANLRNLDKADFRQGTLKVYVQDDQNNELYVVVDPDSYNKWKSDKTIPIVEVVQSYDIYTSPPGGNILPADKPSRAHLEDVLGTSKTEEAVERIIERGNVKNF
ncbi:hypothetical protein BJ944DRAFT_284923 [Cunninghamella echinulata]|nr:hypothetical protein BJ944DRAFT_284923 [Cunninghamella echinulata]